MKRSKVYFAPLPAASSPEQMARTAALDLANQHFGRDIFREFWPKIDARVQLRYGEKIGLGSRAYKLIRVNKS